MTFDRRTASKTLQRIAKLLEVDGENIYRVRAFANAARALERVEGDLAAKLASGELLKLKGVGKGTITVLEELQAGGRPEALDDVERRVPEGVREMLELPGLGPQKVRSLWQDLGVSSVGELAYACRENRLVDLPGFGAKTQQRLLDAIGFKRQSSDQRLISEAWAESVALSETVRDLPGVEEVLVVGEVRRSCETAAAVSLVVVAGDGRMIEKAVDSKVLHLAASGSGRWAGVSESGFALQVSVVEPQSAVGASLWATGSASHLDALGSRAADRGLRLDANGLWRGDQRIECRDEKSLYEALGCQWVPPELREDGTEVVRAAAGAQPELVTMDDVIGVLHNHTTDSDGAASVEEMAAAAAAHGWSFFGVADHSPVVTYANGLDADRLQEQWRRIDAINAEGGVRVLKGIEADILSDGSLDIPEGCETGLDYVVASVHSAFRLSREAQTDRVVRAVSNPACRVLGHPTGRLLLARPGYEIDLETVLQACAEYGVAVEINASPYRLDLDWRWARRALELGLKLCVNPDAHTIVGLDDIRWGIGIARKAGATAADLVNCAPIEEFLDRS